MEKKKKTNKFLFTVIMAFVFVIITEVIIWGYGSTFLYKNISEYPQGALVIKEAIIAVLVLIVMLLFKNSYVFTQKRENVRTGLFYGLFFLIISFFMIIIDGIFAKVYTYYHPAINILIGCLLVGVCEEFLCRGWLLNEFLERFGSNKKGIWYSIIVSGVIFGLMHFGNMLGGQSFSGTLIQVFNAAAIGIVLGVIYYKTKNIWSVVILHGLWDFSLMLGKAAPQYSNTAISLTTSAVTVIMSVLLCFAQMIILIPYFKDIDVKPPKKSIVGYSILACVLYIIFFIAELFTSASIGETYEYGKIKLNNYAITEYRYSHYLMTNNSVNIKLHKNNNKKLALTNTKTNYSIELDCTDLVDYIIVEDNNNYIIGYIDFVDSSNVYLMYKYIPKSTLSNSNEVLDNIKTNMKKYLLPDVMYLYSISSDDKTYLSTYEIDSGRYVLEDEDHLSLLNIE